MFERLDEEQKEAVRAIAREVAREEVASLSGLVLRRLQDEPMLLSGDPKGASERLASIFGEALQNFGSTQTGPGDG